MDAAGLTHGGFYNRFGSRDELIAEAVEHALTDGELRLPELTAGAEDPLAAFADAYVSAAHRDDPASSCGGWLWGRTCARRRAGAGGLPREIERYLAHLQPLLGGDDDARRRATVPLSAMVGAVMIARIRAHRGLG